MQVPDRVIEWLDEGNSKEDLICLYWNALSEEQRREIEDEIDCYGEEGQEH